MEKIDLFWVTQEYDATANGLGYNTHNRYMRKFSEPYFNYTPDAEIALQIAPGDKFIYVPNKINILFTMWEFNNVPDSYKRALEAADAVIVPCKFCKDVFSKIIPAKKIWICREGVDETVYHYHKRNFPDFKKGERFRYLWIGAPNFRKGYAFVLQAIKAFEGSPFAEIYLKTTMPKTYWWSIFKSIKTHWREMFFEPTPDGKKMIRSLGRMIRRIPKPYYNDRLYVSGRYKNIFLDTRKLPGEDLVKLYNSAHCFVLPTCGEGWGLTLSEAMATGCPSLATPVTGCQDYFDEDVGYGIDYIEHVSKLEAYDMDEAHGYMPLTKDLLGKMVYVFQHYHEALKKGKRASNRIRERFTWQIAGARLRRCIDEIDQYVKDQDKVPELCEKS